MTLSTTSFLFNRLLSALEVQKTSVTHLGGNNNLLSTRNPLTLKVKSALLFGNSSVKEHNWYFCLICNHFDLFVRFKCAKKYFFSHNKGELGRKNSLIYSVR